MFLWFPVLDLARAPRRTARKKGSGYENGEERVPPTQAFAVNLTCATFFAKKGEKGKTIKDNLSTFRPSSAILGKKLLSI
jgi:hypothetical protein